MYGKRGSNTSVVFVDAKNPDYHFIGVGLRDSAGNYVNGAIKSCLADSVPEPVTITANSLTPYVGKIFTLDFINTVDDANGNWGWGSISDVVIPGVPANCPNTETQAVFNNCTSREICSNSTCSAACLASTQALNASLVKGGFTALTILDCLNAYGTTTNANASEVACLSTRVKDQGLLPWCGPASGPVNVGDRLAPWLALSMLMVALM